jgi:hypothetical protein
VKSQLSRQDLIAMGERLRLGYLTEQAGYTLARAEKDGAPLAALLPPGFLDSVRQLMVDLGDERQHRTLTAAASKEARRRHEQAVADAKVWRRAVSKRARLSRRMARPLPDGLVAISAVRSPVALAAQMQSMVALLEANLEHLVGTGKEELLAQGRALSEALLAADATQEVKRLAELKQAVARYREKKARLLEALRVIHDAGHSLHAGDAATASQYNFSILRRRAAPRTAAPPAQPAA